MDIDNHIQDFIVRSKEELKDAEIRLERLEKTKKEYIEEYELLSKDEKVKFEHSKKIRLLEINSHLKYYKNTIKRLCN